MDIKCINFKGFGANCYLIDTDDVRIVIDPFELNYKIEYFFNTEKPKFVFLTHCHFDHILGAKKISERFGAKIAIGKHDAIGLYDPYFSLCDMMGCSSGPFYADILFGDNQIFEIGDTKIRVLHTPGHTVGSVCYVLENCIFTGDTLFEGTVGRTDFPGGDFTALKKSLERLKSLSGDYTVFSGHGLSTTLSREKKTNPYMV